MARFMLFLLVVAPMILLISCAGTRPKMIKVNVRKGLETYKLQQAGKDAGDMIFDFKKKLTMIRLPEAKSCFLRTSIGDIPQPAALQKLLQMAGSSANQVKPTKRSVEQLRVVGKFHNRSILSTEMKDLCAKLPIRRVTEGDVSQNDMDQMDEEDEELDVARKPDKRGLPNPDKEMTDTVNKETKRYICGRVCYLRCINIPSGVSCGWGGCRVLYRRLCTRLCVRVCG